MFKPGDIISEAARAEIHECDSAEIALNADALKTAYADLDTIELSAPITADAVPLLAQEVNGEQKFIVDGDILAKYMDANNIEDPNVAIDAIASANNVEDEAIEVGDIVVAMPESSYIERICEESKINDKLGYRVSSAYTFTNRLINAGLKVYKKSE